MSMQTHKNDSTGKQNQSPAIEEIRERNLQEKVAEAHQQADEDIAHDPELNSQDPTDDLDEGEIARLGEDEKQ